MACKTVIQSRIARNISETYLGREAGGRVLAGSIRRGDGTETQAVVWYNDMRNSTALADTMPGKDYIELLNEYFDCTATPVIEAGGEVLDFVGDGVLAIFPYDDAEQQKAAVEAATSALRNVLKARDELNERRREKGLFPIKFGIGLNTGTVMFGNIGISRAPGLLGDRPDRQRSVADRIADQGNRHGRARDERHRGPPARELGQHRQAASFRGFGRDGAVHLCKGTRPAGDRRRASS